MMMKGKSVKTNIKVAVIRSNNQNASVLY